MSVRIGVYDFFAYTVPGVFYILIAVYGLSVFGFIEITPDTLNSLSLTSFLLIIGAGYITGSLLDYIAYRWSLFFYDSPKVARKLIFDKFRKQYPYIELNFKAEDSRIILNMLKHISIEAAMEIELHNVASLMLRNISLGLALLSTIYVLFFLIVNNNLWNLVLAGGSFYFSYVAIKRSGVRRRWFYSDTIGAFVAYNLFQEISIDGKRFVVYRNQENDTNPVKSNPSSSGLEQQPDS